MEEPHNFRSAFNGFRREDVVRYIEYLNKKNANLLNQLTNENSSLQDKLRQILQGDPEETEGLKAQIDRLTSENQQLASENQQLKEQLAALKEQQPTQDLSVQELETYRRAERTERAARERAEQIYRQATAVLAQATTLVEGSFDQYRQAADQIDGQLEQLRLAVDSSKAALEQATSAMYAIRPTEE